MINKKLIAATALMVTLAMPFAAMALNTGEPPAGNPNLDVDTVITPVLRLVWQVFIAFAVVMFLIAAFYFFTSQGEPEKVASARQFVIWGVVSIVIAILAFSLPFVIRNVVNLG